MTRLDEEYDRAEHHDLKRVDEVMSVTGSRVDHIAVCCCNWRSWPHSNYAAAYQEHNEHRDEETGARP